MHSVVFENIVFNMSYKCIIGFGSSERPEQWFLNYESRSRMWLPMLWHAKALTNSWDTRWIVCPRDELEYASTYYCQSVGEQQRCDGPRAYIRLLISRVRHIVAVSRWNRRVSETGSLFALLDHVLLSCIYTTPAFVYWMIDMTGRRICWAEC